MESDTRPIQTEFHKLVAKAVEEGLERIAPLVAEKRRLGTYSNWPYFNWPSISLHKSGLPNFVESMVAGPTDYKSAFGRQQSHHSLILTDDLESFQDLLVFAKSQDYIKRRLLHPGMVEIREDAPDLQAWTQEHLEFLVYRIPEELIDRYIHVNKTCSFSHEAFEAVYAPYARSIFEERLFLDICIPILFLKFDFDQIELGTNVELVQMNEEFQLARAPLSSYGAGVHKSVLPAATHMLVLNNWYITNPNRWQLPEIISEVGAYPLDHIDSFFAALRIVTGFSTGYAQLLMRPKGWALNYKADLPILEGTSIKAYPNSFERYYWLNEDIPEIDKETAQEIGNTFVKLLDVTENSVHIAARRLNLCFLRDDEEDSILDATIGLEALLSHDSQQEMTHKLAMRVGALTKILEAFSKSPHQVFRELKKIYGYRSAVVHGSTKAHKKREIVSGDNRRIPASSLAIDYLRIVLRILIDHPQYRKPAKIDEELLLGSRSGWENPS